MSGDNWELKTTSGTPLARPIYVYSDPFLKNPNILQKSVPLVSNVMYSALNSDCGSLTLTDLLAGEEYTLTLYGFPFESTGLRKSFLDATDGSIIVNIDQDENGESNGQLLTYKY